MATSYKAPFPHWHIPNFLSNKNYEKLIAIYNGLEFKQKESDLFHFFQTNELQSLKSLKFFKEELSNELIKLGERVDEDSFYNIFASYYFKGDYLLCHDDVIEDRKYAFSYYLEDHPSGQLVLYDETATKIHKKIAVTKNTLVIFEVSNKSYHQVAFCQTQGRKAVTGWFNIKGYGATRLFKELDQFQPNIIKQSLKYPIDQNITDEEFFQFPEIDYQFNVVKSTVEGPFYSKKVTRLSINPVVVFEIKGYELVSSDFYKFSEGDYLLLNDPVNNLGENILDLFITHLPEKTKQSEDILLQISNETGHEGGIPYTHDCLFIVKRAKRQYYVDRVKQQFMIGHLIYRKIEKSSSKKKNVIKTRNVRQIRQKLVSQLNQSRVQIKHVPQNIIKKCKIDQKLVKNQSNTKTKTKKVSKKIKKSPKRIKKIEKRRSKKI